MLSSVDKPTELHGNCQQQSTSTALFFRNPPTSQSAISAQSAVKHLMVRELPTSPCTPSPQPAVGWEAASRAGADPDSSDSQPRAPQGYSWPSHTAPSCCQARYVPIGLMENKSSAPTRLRDQRRGNKVPFQTLVTSCHPGHCPPRALQRVWLWLHSVSLPAARALGHTKPPPKLQAAALCAACRTRQCPLCYWARGRWFAARC